VTLVPYPQDQGLPPEAPPEQLPQQEYGGQFAEEVDALCHAIKSAAEKASASDEPEAVQRFLTGAFMGAQAIEKLSPVKPDPNVTTKATADVVREGAKLAASESRAAEPSGTQAKMGATDGKRNTQQR
jgi:hypothetical protein